MEEKDNKHWRLLMTKPFKEGYAEEQLSNQGYEAYYPLTKRLRKRKNKMQQPLAFMVMQRFLKVGFLLKEDIIKHQHDCKATGFWVKKSKDYNFLLIMHEHLFIFQKN